MLENRHLIVLLALLMAAPSCNDKEKPDPRAIEPDFYCPGGLACPDDGSDVLMAGAAKAAITPEIIDTITDVDENGDFEPHPMGEDIWHDNNENGEWDFIWLAGYGTKRPANEVHDDIWARTVVLRWKSTTVAIVSLDLVGYFIDDVMDIRDSVADLDIDFVIVHATHDHEAPDVIGIWGFDETTPGWDEDYFELVRGAAEDTIREAYDAMVPAKAAFGTSVPAHPEHGLCNTVIDGRDPYIINEVLTTIRFIDAADDATIATLVNWASHPESADDHTHFITSDWPHYMREGVENGIHKGDTDMDGVGGITILISGALGGQIGHPHKTNCKDLEGNVIGPGDVEDIFDRVQCIGDNLAVHALEAISSEGEPTDACPIELRVKQLELVVENYGFHSAIINNLLHIHRRDYGFDRTRPIRDDNLPHFLTEVSWLRIGPAQAIILGGELSPEIAIGGYDGSHTPECAYTFRGIDRDTLCKPDNPNPPDMSQAPGPPYLFDFLADLDAQYPMIWGTTNDMLGYMLPAFDYELAERGAYIEEAPGDHYEETNSVGPEAWPEMERHIVGILVWKE